MLSVEVYHLRVMLQEQGFTVYLRIIVAEHSPDVELIAIGYAVKLMFLHLGMVLYNLRSDLKMCGAVLASPTFTLYSMFFLLYKRLRLTPAALVYYRFSL